MADFVQTMKDWRRMCDSFKSCNDCPMMDEDGWAHILCSEGGIRNAEPEKSVEIITRWAAEHPVVYPTWREYLMSQIMPYGTGDWSTLLLEHPIPADIAEKLGLQPKEG